MAFDGIVLSRVTELLTEQIKTARITKIYQISRYELLLHIRGFHTNVKLLISIHPVYARIQLTKLDYPTPDFPNSLTMLLRKHLEGCIIEDVEQIGLSRILRLVLRGRNEFKDTVYYHVYIEIMGKHSNFVLTDDQDLIIDCLKRVSPSESTRYLQPHIHYEIPPLIVKHDPFKEGYIETTNLIKTYDGFSKDLAAEVSYAMSKGQQFEDIMSEIKQSRSLYITLNDSHDYYHVIPLTSKEGDIQEYGLFDGLDHYYDYIDQKDRIKQQTSDLSRYIKQEYTKNVNKLNKLENTLFDSQNSDEYRIKGDLLYASLHLIQKGMKEITVDNYYDGTQMVIALDERYDGKTNANRYYNKYQKAKNSIKVLNEQIEKTKEEIVYFDTLMTMIDQATYYDAIEIKEELENLGYLKKKKVKKLKKKTQLHYETFQTKDGITIYVGKNNLQNDYLTFKLARRSDWWFHVKDMPGSHVIVHAQELDEYTIRLAATIAAFYSKGRLSSSVPVNYTEVKTLKKPHSNKPGMVLLGHYKTIYIDPDDQFLSEIHKVK